MPGWGLPPVTGLALVIFAIGMTGYLGESVVGVPPPVTFERIELPGLSDIPVLGRIFFTQDALVYLSYALVPATWWILFRTRTGLNRGRVVDRALRALVYRIRTRARFVRV